MVDAVALGMREGWYARNERVTRGVKLVRSPQDVLTEEHMFTPHELDHLPYNAEFAKRLGLRSFAGFMFAVNGSSSVYCSLERHPNEGSFAPHEMAAIRRAVPHLQRAGRLALSVGDAQARGVLDGLEALRCGGVLLDAGGRVVGVNEQARAYLGGRGLTVSREGHLAAGAREANAALQRLVAGVLEHVQGTGASAIKEGGHAAVVVPSPRQEISLRQIGGPGPLLLHASPLVGAASALFQRARALVMITDPSEHREPAEPVLRQAFGLTPAEARVALAFSRGEDTREVASACGVSPDTVRAHLKALFARTGTRRQAELVALIARFRVP